MAVSIYQLNLPFEIKELIKEYVFFSMAESTQRSRKRMLVRHLTMCERWCFMDDFFTSFYYNQLRTIIRYPYQSRWYTIHEYYVLHAGFCNECHNYIYANTAIPHCIECNCNPTIMPDVD